MSFRAERRAWGAAKAKNLALDARASPAALDSETPTGEVLMICEALATLPYPNRATLALERRAVR
jgi:hypothetical protein